MLSNYGMAMPIDPRPFRAGNSGGPASVVWSPVDISRPKSWPDDALNVEFAAPVWAAMTEPVALSSLAGDKTS